MFETFKTIAIKKIVSLTMIGLLMTGILFSYAVQNRDSVAKSSTDKQDVSPQTINGKKAGTEMPVSLTEAVTKAQYKAEKLDGKLIASNHANGLKAEFDETGLSLRSLSKTADWQSNWRLQSFGYGDRQSAVKSGELISEDQRVEITRKEQNLVEWFENRPDGLEHGYTLSKRPNNTGSTEALRLVMSVSGDLKPTADPNGQALKLKDINGREVLQYSKLKVWDADNKEQVARMEVKDNKVFLEVEEANAKYPLTIDPTFETGKLLAPDGTSGDGFGYSVDIEGNTAVIGATFDVTASNGRGSVYIFEKIGSIWTFQQKLNAFDGSGNNNFGDTVSISGDTLVVGSAHDSNPGSLAGSAYVYVRSGTTWSLEQKLLPAVSTAFGQFGIDLEIDGDTVVIGENGNSSGAAYVFVRSGTTWTQQQKLTGSLASFGDNFGVRVDLNGDSAIVGAYYDDITGAANCGGNQSCAGQRGTAYVFTRSGAVWSEEQILFASDGQPSDFFGFDVEISGDTAIVGSNLDDVGGNANQGSVYVYTRSGTIWTEVKKIVASDGAASDRLGSSIAIEEDKAIIGSFGDDSAKGSVYVFERNSGGADNWGEVDNLVASDGAVNDWFSYKDVASSGGIILIGAYQDDDNGTNSGSAYIYELTPPNTAPTISSAGAGVTQGDSANQQIATVGDAEDNEDDLTVTVDGGASATTNGVTVSGLAVAPDGSVTADVAAADCIASNANFTLDVFDGGGLTASTSLFVAVSPETQKPVIDPVSDIAVTLPTGSASTSVVVSFPTPTATDNCGTPTVTTSPVSGSLFSLGTTPVTVDATDAAGNTETAAFNVLVQYNFNGFFDPIDNLDVNLVKAGRGIPVKFSLDGDFGLNIMAAGYPVSYETPCDGNGDDGDEIPTVTAGNSSLSYDADSDRYNYVWKTDKGWAGTCRVLVVQLNDGTLHTANFKFK